MDPDHHRCERQDGGGEQPRVHTAAPQKHPDQPGGFGSAGWTKNLQEPKASQHLRSKLPSNPGRAARSGQFGGHMLAPRLHPGASLWYFPPSATTETPCDGNLEQLSHGWGFAGPGLWKCLSLAASHLWASSWVLGSGKGPAGGTRLPFIVPVWARGHVPFWLVWGTFASCPVSVSGTFKVTTTFYSWE